MATQMASTRQPFAPLNSSRLQNLTSLKNRQNAQTTLTSPSKRKAPQTFDFDFDSDPSSNSENIDPVIFLSPKRSKQPDGSHSSSTKPSQPTNYFLTRAPPSPNDFSSFKQSSTTTTTSPARAILNARSPMKQRLDTSTGSRATPLSAPAGRSPTRKRIGILNRRKTAGGGGSPFTRVDPPRFSTPSSSSLGFSIDAALSGTIPSYKPASAAPVVAAPPALPIPELYRETAKDSWFFEIHVDTEEELAENLMQHGACTLDISSDEENERRERDGRGKENVPPVDDVSQTRTVGVVGESLSSSSGLMGAERESEMKEIKARIGKQRAERRVNRKVDEGAIEVDRSPLGEMPAEDFYADGVQAGEVVVVVDEHEHSHEHSESSSGHQSDNETEAISPLLTAKTFDFTADVVGKGKGVEVTVNVNVDAEVVEVLMGEGKGGCARLLEPIEKVEGEWTVWESGSAKGDDE